MKTFTAVLLFAVILGCKIEVDAGSFNLSGSLDPGISFGRSRSHQQKYQASKIKNDDDESGWPQPNHINTFEKPESFNEPVETGSKDNERSQTHKHRPRHRAYRH